MNFSKRANPNPDGMIKNIQAGGAGTFKGHASTMRKSRAVAENAIPSGTGVPRPPAFRAGPEGLNQPGFIDKLYGNSFDPVYGANPLNETKSSKKVRDEASAKDMRTGPAAQRRRLATKLRNKKSNKRV